MQSNAHPLVRRIGLGAAAALMLAGGGLASGVAGASTAKHHGHGDHHQRQGDRGKGGHDGGRYAGTVTQVDAATGDFTISQGSNTLAVTMTSSTTLFEHGAANPTVAVGDSVLAWGSISNNTLAATRVVIKAPEREDISGQIAAITPAGTGSTGTGSTGTGSTGTGSTGTGSTGTGSTGTGSTGTGTSSSVTTLGTIAIDRGDHQIVVSITSATTFSEEGVTTAPTFATLTVGERVTVVGTGNSTDFVATSVKVKPAHYVALIGTVTGTATGGFALAVGDHHSVAVAVSASTVYVGSTGSSTSSSGSSSSGSTGSGSTGSGSGSTSSSGGGIATGTTVAVIGTRVGGDGSGATINAATVVILP